MQWLCFQHELTWKNALKLSWVVCAWCAGTDGKSVCGMIHCIMTQRRSCDLKQPVRRTRLLKQHFLVFSSGRQFFTSASLWTSLTGLLWSLTNKVWAFLHLPVTLLCVMSTVLPIKNKDLCIYLPRKLKTENVGEQGDAIFASELIKTKITALMTCPPKVKQSNDDFITFWNVLTHYFETRTATLQRFCCSSVLTSRGQ